jgi:signal transduction histidine kinase
MGKPRTLQLRITVAYLLFALAACLLFAVIAAVAVEGIEVKLVDERLQSVAAWASPRHVAGLPAEMPAGLIFYHGDSIPVSLRNLEPGVQEKTVDGVGLQMLVGSDSTGNFVVVDRNSDYERIEVVVYSIVAAGLSALLVISAFLGRYIARRFVDPISSLAAAVMQKDAQADLPLLANSDEMGVLARAFSARTDELKQYLVRERFFTGDVSHELRTPLTIIIGAAEILVERTAGQPGLNAPADRILRAAREAADCVTVLLLLARAPQLLDAPETKISDIIREQGELGRLLCRDKPVSLALPRGADLTVLARPELLSTAIGNLIRNACQYTRSGEVAVRVQAQSVIVEDTGPGLPPTVRARLFDELPRSSTADSAGSGIGLALVKRICEHLGAVLRMEDRLGGGTVFAIDFPSRIIKS